MHRRVHRSWLPIVIAALAVLVILPSLAGETDAATSKWQARCTANVRAYPNTSSRISPATNPVTAPAAAAPSTAPAPYPCWACRYPCPL